MTLELAPRHELTVLASRIDDGPHTRLSDSVSPPPTFAPFQDGAAKIEPLRVSLARRAAMAPLIAHATPGLRRYAYGSSRPAAAELVARVVGPVIARAADGADLIHLWAGDLLASAAIRAGRDAGIPVVITPFAHEGQWGYDRASVRAYQSACRVAALLGTEADFYARLGVDRRRIEIAGVCTPGAAKVDQDLARRRLGVSAGPLIVFLGARRPYKGFDLLLQAAPTVTSVHPDAVFAFVGPGAALAEVDRSGRILDVGPVTEEDKALWLCAADVLCLPSSDEILPVSVLEAWSVGTPVLTSDIPTLAELVALSGGGKAVPRKVEDLANGLCELLAEPDGLARMGAKGHQTWLEHYTPGRVAARYEDMYSRVVAAPVRS